ncbi:MAG TPA: rRNA maturation RNase YbeY [Clostridia bacterium]|nr:rRNA maturation RNase YbeY [Clostridia bacterium]
MKVFLKLNYINTEENDVHKKIARKVIDKCFREEKLNNVNIYVNIIFTDLLKIKEINKEFRNIDKETDVLSFPMFEKNELENLTIFKKGPEEVLGDIIIAIPQVEKQAIEYDHSFERELSYMIVHGFYHLMGYDHIIENDKLIMRQKEENILKKLKISR